MPAMGNSRRCDERRNPGLLQPARGCGAQDSAFGFAKRYWLVVGGGSGALAGDHEDKSQAPPVGGAQKFHQSAMGGSFGQTVEVEAVFRFDLPTAQAVRGASIKAGCSRARQWSRLGWIVEPFSLARNPADCLAAPVQAELHGRLPRGITPVLRRWALAVFVSWPFEDEVFVRRHQFCNGFRDEHIQSAAGLHAARNRFCGGASAPEDVAAHGAPDRAACILGDQ